MANVDFFSAFGYAWGENGSVDDWVDTQYKLGWASIGSVPPSVEQFNRVQQLADQKANWLFGQIAAAAAAKEITLSASDLTALVQILAATAPDASTTKKGLIEIATATEAKALDDALRAVTPATLGAVLAEFRSGIPGATFADIDALTEDDGPIIVTDMACVAPWVWTNTAYFTGYRNPLCATIPQHFATAPRAWEISVTGGVWSVDDPKAKRVIAWFREQGHVVAVGDWATGWGRIADLGGGNWKAPDLQDAFLRIAGTDRDTANAAAVGVYQSDALQNITGVFGPSWTQGTAPTGNGVFGVNAKTNASLNSTGSSASFTSFDLDASRVARASSETRPEGVRVSPAILI